MYYIRITIKVFVLYVHRMFCVLYAHRVCEFFNIMRICLLPPHMTSGYKGTVSGVIFRCCGVLLSSVSELAAYTHWNKGGSITCVRVSGWLSKTTSMWCVHGLNL